MAGSSASWCTETDEKINYTKLCRLLVDGGTQAVRSVFDGIHQPSSLKAVLNANRATLQSLRRPRGRVLNNEQWDKLYPPSGSNPKSEDFDITLLFVLLRNICGLTPPATGWDILPPVTDNSQKANLARIKYYRNNTIAHKPNTEINDVDFEQHWQDILSALLSLGASQDDIDDLKSAPLGKKDYNQLLQDWYVSDQDIKTQLDDLKSDTAVIKSDTTEIKSDTADIKSDTADIKSDTARIKSDTADIKSDTADIKSDTAEIKSDTARIKSDTADIKSDTADIKSDTALIPGIQEGISQLKKLSSTHVKDSPINQLANSDFCSLIESLCKSFHPNTRQWVLDEVKSFIYQDPSELVGKDYIEKEGRSQPRRGMLITAGPGMGKSVIAAKTCQMYKNLGCLGGCHFFQFSNSTRNNPRLMLQSIARQMCNTVPGYRDALESKLQSNFGKELLDLRCEELFTVLFEEPCNKLQMNEANTKTFVIVVDALDECCNDLKSEFFDILERKLDLLPSWLRFIITTRPGNANRSLIVKVKNFGIDPEDNQNKLDLEKFFKDKLGTLCKRDDMAKLVTQLVKITKGLFLVAFFVVDYLRKEGISPTSDVLGLFPKGISSVYEKYFTRLQGVLLPYISNKNNFFKMLEAVAAAKHPIEKNIFYGILGLKNQRKVRDIPGLSIKARQTALDLLHSLFPVENDHVTVFHKSVVDWLIQGDTEHDFSVRSKDDSEAFAHQSLDYERDSKEDLQTDASSVRPENKNEDVVVSESFPAADVQSSSPEPLKKDECSSVPHEFIVSVEDGNEVLASQCYDVLSDIRNGKKDLDKPLTLTDSEKYALEFGLDYISHTLSNDKKMEVLNNCFVICSASYLYYKTYKFPLEGDSSHFDVSKEISRIVSLGYYSYNHYDNLHKQLQCPFRSPFHFIHLVGFMLQVVRAFSLNQNELSPNPAELFDKYRVPFLIWNHITVIPGEEFYPITSVMGLIPDRLSMTKGMILPCKDGMVRVKYNGRQTLVHKYIEDGTCLIEKTFPGLKKMCITPDLRFLVATEVDSRGDVEIINASSLELVTKYQSPNVVKSCHVFGQQPWYIVARCYNNKIYVIEGATGEILTAFNVHCDENVEGVSSCGHIALSKTWIAMRVNYPHMYDGLFTDDDGNFLEEMKEMGKNIGGSTANVCRKLFLLNALEPGERVCFYPRRETVCPCRYRCFGAYDFYFHDQAIAFSEDGTLLAYNYFESIYIVKSQDGSLFKRLYVDHVCGNVDSIIHLSESQIILRGMGGTLIMDVATNQIKHLVYLPANVKELFLIPKQQDEPLAFLVKHDNDEEVREERFKKYSIFRYVFHNLDL